MSQCSYASDRGCWGGSCLIVEEWRYKSNVLADSQAAVVNPVRSDGGGLPAAFTPAKKVPNGSNCSELHHEIKASFCTRSDHEFCSNEGTQAACVTIGAWITQVAL